MPNGPELVQQFAGAYIDILVYSYTWEEHLKHLEAVWKELRKAGLKVNSKKCRIARQGVTYLGYQINQEKIQPVLEKVEKINDRNPPKKNKTRRRRSSSSG